MLKKLRRIVAMTAFVLITLLFLDFTGSLHLWFGWLAKIQLVPAILSVNLVIVLGLLLLTLLFGRVYCSVICPLGVFQDGVSFVSAHRKGKKNRFRYSQSKSSVRYGLFVLFIIAFAMSITSVLNTGAIVSLLDPYSGYGRMASNFLSPAYGWGNNLLAWFAERADSYSFYPTEVWLKGFAPFAVALCTFFIVGSLAWRNGRTYCNTICPVGTFLGFISRFSIFKITLDTNKCTNCKACERSCKASCINLDTITVDHSRCVSCFNCLNKCKFGAINFNPINIGAKKACDTNNGISEMSEQNTANEHGLSRRSLFGILGSMALASTLKAQEIQVDGGLAEIVDKKKPVRNTPIVPPGASSAKNMREHCTACQLCVSACPNNVLEPSNKLASFMQPEMSFERGYCRPECTECSQVCPTRAINTVSKADKSAISLGHAVWIKDNCVVNHDDIQCYNCQRHCPTGAITLVKRNPNDINSLKIPTVDKELCIGCGACEHLCPARPFSAIYVEGHVRHHSL